MELMIECCVMNGYCPNGNSRAELYLITIVTILVIIMMLDFINNYIKR